ncbi:MAG: sigma-70 family RNA polymerase sigma factor [Ruminococcus sp.]|nr:sigma-70 family RNA polymerase sigma factor [Ruminococcus sp.]
MTDTEWENMFRESPSQAYGLFIEEYGNLIYAIVINKIGGCGTKEDVEDCVSDIMVEFFKNAERFSADSGSLKSYISIIAKRRAIDAFREITGRNGIVYDMDDDNIVLPPSDNDTAGEAEKHIFSRELWNIVKSLGEPDCSIIVYQYFYNHTVQETAQRLDMTSDAVQKRSIRARKKIGTILKSGDYYD